MRTVRIIGGGLTGILAAFEAHRLGARNIVLHERSDQLGGVARARTAYGVELRDGTIYFGPPEDEMVALLASHGVEFDVFENRFASISPGHDGPVLTQDFGGPALPCPSLQLQPYGASLASRLAAYPDPIRQSLSDYCAWHLGCDLDVVHESAAIPLAINRVIPLGQDPAEVAACKTKPLWDELYGLPRGQWGRTANSLATLPRGGFSHMFDLCHARLQALGVRIETASLMSPREALLTDPAEEIIVWAANPTPLFKPLGLKSPALVRKTFAAYQFEAAWTGPLPFYLQNFTASGSVFRAYVYQSGGKTVLTAECVSECGDAALRRELAQLMEPCGAGLKLGLSLGVSVQPRWIYHSVEAMRQLKALRAGAANHMGASFVAGAWEPYGKTAKYKEVRAALETALQTDRGQLRAVG